MKKTQRDEKSWTAGLCAVPCPWCAVLAPRVHQLKCDRKPTQCPQCGYGCTRAGLTVHMEKCPSKMINCPGCRQSMAQGSLDEHLTMECKSRSFVCDDCSQAFWIVEEYRAHVQPHCPRRLVACQLCSSLVPNGNLAAHYLECSNRQLRKSQHHTHVTFKAKKKVAPKTSDGGGGGGGTKSADTSFGAWDANDGAEKKEGGESREDPPASDQSPSNDKKKSSGPKVNPPRPNMHSPLRTYKRSGSGSASQSFNHISSLAGESSTSVNSSSVNPPASSVQKNITAGAKPRAASPGVNSLRPPTLQVRHLKSAAYKRSCSPDQDVSVQIRNHQDPNSGGDTMESRPDAKNAEGGEEAQKKQDTPRGRSSQPKTPPGGRPSSGGGRSDSKSIKRSHSQGSATSTTVQHHQHNSGPTVRRNLVQESLHDIDPETVVEPHSGRRFGTLPKKEQQAVLLQLKTARQSAVVRRKQSPAPRSPR